MATFVSSGFLPSSHCGKELCPYKRDEKGAPFQPECALDMWLIEKTGLQAQQEVGGGVKQGALHQN